MKVAVLFGQLLAVESVVFLSSNVSFSYMTSYEASYETSYETSYGTSYESSYETSYESSYGTSYETSYAKSYDFRSKFRHSYSSYSYTDEFDGSRSFSFEPALAPSVLPSIFPSPRPSVMPSQIPTPAPSSLPTSPVPTSAPTQDEFVVTLTYEMSVKNAATTDEATTILEAACFDDSFANLTETLVRASYLDDSGDFPTNVDLTLVDVTCSIVNSSNSTFTNDAGDTFSGAGVVCFSLLLREEAVKLSDGGRMTSADIETKLTAYVESEAVNSSDTLDLLIALSENNADSSCAEALSTPISDILEEGRRRLQEDTLGDSLEESTVESVVVVSETPVPTSAPTSVPSLEPTSMPSLEPTETPTDQVSCSTDEQCPEGQVCQIYRRRRHLIFGYATGVCAPE